MMCQRIGLSPISTIGLGRTPDSSAMRVPRPPARMTHFICYIRVILFQINGLWLQNRCGRFRRLTEPFAAAKTKPSFELLSCHAYWVGKRYYPGIIFEGSLMSQFWSGRRVLLTGHTGFKGA